MRALLTVFALLALGACASGPTFPVGDVWEVTLSVEQAEKFAELSGEEAHTAFAVSPDGIWGRATGRRSAQEASQAALAFCAQHTRLNASQCILYSVDGARVAPASVTTTPVTARYEAVSPSSAQAFFPTVAVTHTGDVSAQRAFYAQLQSDPNALATAPRDAELRAALIRSSIVATSARMVIWLDEAGAEIHNMGSNGRLERIYQDWHVTADGLMCLNRGQWASTGRSVGMTCIEIREIASGEVEAAWAGNGADITGVIVRGDARFSTSR